MSSTNSETFSLTIDQTKSIEQFSKLKIGALFMRQGTGKTRAALELASFNVDKYENLLYICPFSVKDEARKEFDKWLPEVDNKIVGYESISSSDRVYIETLDYVKESTAFLICDESIFVKNADAKRTRRVNDIRKECDYCFILNGTPVTKDVFDLKRQIDLLSPKIIGMSDGEFRDTFFAKIESKHKYENPKVFYRMYEPNIQYLMSLIRPYVYQCEFSFDHNETDHEHDFASSEESSMKYDEIRDAMLEKICTFDDPDIINYLAKLNHISASDKNRADAISKKVEEFSIVMCGFIDEVENISAAIGKCHVITGDTKNRRAVIDKFEQDGLPLVTTYGTSSFGLNLQAAKSIHFSSGLFDFGRVQQAKARIKRMGQVNDIEYHHYLSDLKIDRFIRSNVDKKQWLDDLVVKNMKVADMV